MSEHCWHDDRAFVKAGEFTLSGIVQESLPINFSGGTVQRCCFCGKERAKFVVRIHDPSHGDYVYMEIDKIIYHPEVVPDCKRDSSGANQ